MRKSLEYNHLPIEAQSFHARNIPPLQTWNPEITDPSTRARAHFSPCSPFAKKRMAGCQVSQSEASYARTRTEEENLAKGPVSRILFYAVIPLGAASPLALISDLPGGFGTFRAAWAHRADTQRRLAPAALPSLFGLAPCGVYPASVVTAGAVRSYRTFSPLPRHRTRSPNQFWRTVSGVALVNKSQPGRYLLCGTSRL